MAALGLWEKRTSPKVRADVAGSSTVIPLDESSEVTPAGGKGSLNFAAATVPFERATAGDDPDAFFRGIAALRPILEALGTPVFKTFQGPIYNNVALLRARRAAHGASAPTATALALAELGGSGTRRAAPPPRDSTAIALARLYRIIEFVHAIFEELAEAERVHSARGGRVDLGGVALRAYARTLEAHHPRLLRVLVRRGVVMLPSRAELYRRLEYADGAHARRDLERCAQAMTPELERLGAFFAENDVGAL